MNEFGGKWTEEKIAVFIKYAKAYLEVMKTRSYFRLLYFDGFAGSGIIDPNEEADTYELIQGVATQVLSITQPREFDLYYFVEKKRANSDKLRTMIKESFPGKRAHVVNGDCNDKVVALADYMRKPENKNVRTLAFLDPYGMQLDWCSLQSLQGVAVDVWILVPTGIGVGRLLRNDGKIEASWMNRLKSFLGMEEEEIFSHFYRRHTQNTLFGEHTQLLKEPQATERAAQLYRSRILEAGIFEHVSTPRVLKNSIGMPMYHFIMCTNNTAALQIANTIKFST